MPKGVYKRSKSELKRLKGLGCQKGDIGYWKGKKPPSQCGFQKGHTAFDGVEKTWFKKGITSINSGKTFEQSYGLEKAKELKMALSKSQLGNHNSPATQFKKGHKTWNKDKKCPQLAGENHYLWKGGITSLSGIIRECSKGKQWKSNVFQRDNWTCQTCGARSARGQAVLLNAHHIRPFADIIEYYEIISLKEALKCKAFWDVGNGVTLCEECHKLTHKPKLRIESQGGG